MKTHRLQQNTKKWHEFRAKHFTASDASAMLGLSKYKTRSELLREKATGERQQPTEFQQRLFDKGHRAEALMRPLIEKRLGEDLSPMTATHSERTEIACSFDGITLFHDVIWEHKLHNQALLEYIETNDDLPDTHWPQLEQQLFISGAEYAIFTVSDGTIENRFDFTYRSQPERLERLLDGWTQFAKDLSQYTIEPTTESKKVAIVEVKSLPDIAFKLNKLTLEITSNMGEYKSRALMLIDEAQQPLKTESDFGRAEKIVKEFKKAETKLDEYKLNVLGEMKSINDFLSDIDEIKESIRQARLLTDKQVKSKKLEIKSGILGTATTTIATLYSELNAKYSTQVSCQSISTDLNTAIKGKSNLDKIQDAVDDVVANHKIAITNIENNLRQNMKVIKLHAEYRFLFSDWIAIAETPNEEFALLVDSRIEDYKAKEAEAKALAEAKAEAEAKALAEAKAQAKAKAKAEVEAEKTAPKMESIPVVEMTQEQDKDLAKPARAIENDLVREQTFTADCIEITVAEYKELLRARSMLDALINAGVDNWSGYKHALKHLEA